MITEDNLKQWLVDHEIDEVEALVPDMAGVARGKYVPAKKFPGAESMRLPESLFIQTVTGEFVEEPVMSPADRDMIVRPDLSTLRHVPWSKEPTACVIHDCFEQDGKPMGIAPRQVLRRVLDLYKEAGMVPVVAPEIEFYLVQKNANSDHPLEPPVGRTGRKETVRQPYSMDAVDEFEPLIEAIYDFCESQQIDADNLIHEMGPAQLEINFEHGDAMALADQMFLFKRLAREAPLRHDVFATFMAKPMEDEPGSAMHWHISLKSTEDGRNVFSTPDGGESEVFRNFIAGQQAFMPQVTLLCAPYVNSYRRFTRWTAAPINLQWGYDNRTVGLRVPQSNADNRRVENRLAGADVNPYLAIAAKLACGLLGIRNGLKPTAPETGSAYSLPFALPRNLYAAIGELEGSDEIAGILGQRFVEVYAACKRHEYQTYFQVISPWERENLLLNV